MTAAAIPLDTAREIDSNGWFEIQDNPISKVGVFPYRGSMIDPNGEMGLNPEGIYQVYRSAEALSDPETVESFKLIPWIDDHEMLGAEDGLTDAALKGVKGTIGENVHYDDGYLYANIKLFCDSHGSEIDKGKRELSAGYRCKYRLESGLFGDKAYTVVQDEIRGNHLASVDEGRMGPDVSVLDHKIQFTIDAKDFKHMAPKATTLKHPETGESITLDEAEKLLGTQNTEIVALKAKGLDADDDEKKDTEDMDDEDRDMGQDEDEDEKGEDADDDEKKDTEDMGDHPDGKDEDDEKKGMDAKGFDEKLKRLERKVARNESLTVKKVMGQIRRRDSLYAKVSEVTGAFDHDDMNEREVAQYACEKIGLKAPKGQEVTAIGAYFHNRTPTAAFTGDVLDVSRRSMSQSKSSAVANYLSGPAN